MLFFALEGRPIQEFRRNFNISEKIYRTAYEKILFFNLGRPLGNTRTTLGQTRGKHFTFLEINNSLVLEVFPHLLDLQLMANFRRTSGELPSTPRTRVPIADFKKLTNYNYVVLDFSTISSFSELLEDHRSIGPPENATHLIETISRLAEYQDIPRQKLKIVFNKFEIFAQEHGFRPSVAGFARWLSKEKGLRAKKINDNKTEIHKNEVVDPYAI